MTFYAIFRLAIIELRYIGVGTGGPNNLVGGGRIAFGPSNDLSELTYSLTACHSG